MKKTLPIVILVRPQMGENIGAAARAMGNFGLKELRLVAPRDGWPNKKALEMSSDGKSIVERAKVFPDTAAAMHDIAIAYGTTARPRDIEKRVVDARAAMKEAHAHVASGAKVALVFGPERTGLENDDIGWCDTLITLPTAPGHSSLNLAQSAVVVLYEWFSQSDKAKVARALPKPAAKKDWQGLFDQLEHYLEEAEYYRTPHKKPIMWRNMKNMLLRGGWSEQELRTFRGMLRVLHEGRKPRRQS